MSSATLNKQSNIKKENEYKRIYLDHLLNPAKLKWHHSLRPCEQQGQPHIFNFCVFAPVAQIWKVKKSSKKSAIACLMCFFSITYLFIVFLFRGRSTLWMLSDGARQDGAEVFYQSCEHSSRTITSSSGGCDGVIEPSAKEIIEGG